MNEAIYAQVKVNLDFWVSKLVDFNIDVTYEKDFDHLIIILTNFDCRVSITISDWTFIRHEKSIEGLIDRYIPNLVRKLTISKGER